MRLVARRMRDKAEELEEQKVDTRKEDRTIRSFTIPAQQNLIGEIIHISAYAIIKNHKPVQKKTDIKLRKNQHLLLQGPNGIGKSTLLELIAKNESKGTKIADGVEVMHNSSQCRLDTFAAALYNKPEPKCWHNPAA